MKIKSNNLINFLFEAATLKRLKRTGWQILGGNEESVAEHSFIVAVISFILATQLKVNVEKVLLIALFHDISEARTGDIYKLADLYVKVDEKKAEEDSLVNLPMGNNLKIILEEYKKEKTLEAKIVHDADKLALCLELKQLMENGNLQAGEWFEANIESLRLDVSRQLANQLKKSDSQDWWKREREILHKRMNRV